MSNPYIDAYRCNKKHIIFTGRNALAQAIFFDEQNRIATPDDLYQRRFDIDHCATWGYETAKSHNHVQGTEVVGDGVHAKMYILPNGSVIFSSQNNCSSALFEFAILYQADGKEKMKSLKAFTMKSIKRAKDFSSWWAGKRKWIPRIGRNN